jgi:uncharacterized protein
MCIVTREVKDEADLIRFARAPTGEVVPDVGRKLPGRGVWVSLSRSRVAEAVRRKQFARGFDANVEVDDGLAEVTGQALRRQALGYLSLARKGGTLVSGATKVEKVLERGEARVLVHASEAAEHGREKLDRLAGPETAIVTCLTSAEMDLALGRENVIHAAIIKGGLAEKLLAAARRVERYEAP